MSNPFDAITSSLDALLGHPSVSIPTEVQPNVDAIKTAVATAQQTVTDQLAAAVIPAVNHEITTVLTHNHMATAVPMVVSVFDLFASWWVAGRRA